MCPFRVNCLNRSLALLWFSHRAGIVTRLRLGVIPAPFVAHAWVEYDGGPVNDNEESLTDYVRFHPLSMEVLM
jgi:hypothetical protein